MIYLPDVNVWIAGAGGKLGSERSSMARTLIAAFVAASALCAQTPVSVLVPKTSLHDHYLFSRSQHFDGQDYTGLPWRFYYANVGSNPPPATLRTRCVLQPVDGTPV